MPQSDPIHHDFLNKITGIIEENIANEQFGVSELAEEIGMSRSNLLRKVKKLSKISASQYIRQVRLQRAMRILGQTSLTVSEIAYKVGFGSPSYFIKCFREYYGYPPGEAGRSKNNIVESEQVDQTTRSHQLAAIMFTDIEGYTALMQQDEEKAIAFRNRHREIFEAATKRYKGRILQYYGDGTLSTFHSAIDAVKCGIELQLSYREDPVIPVRIGIHSGDILFSEDGIIGDGVNVAARIESLAAAGSVFISEKVFDEVKNQSGIQTAAMGVFELKNVDKPMEVFAITNQGLAVPSQDQITGRLKENSTLTPPELNPKVRRAALWIIIIIAAIFTGYLFFTTEVLQIGDEYRLSTDLSLSEKSIAVLPFINDSNDSSNVYIINGLMEAILNNLQKIEGLRVISRTSSEKYRNNPKTSPEIARELNVTYLIEGSGQKIGDKILLNIQLIEARDDQHLWSEQYHREVRDIFTLQGEVAKNIAEKIQVIITPEEENRIDKAPTDDLVAYDYFLKGLDLLKKVLPESVQESIPYFEKAIEQDPKFARAYAALAMAYYWLDEGQAEKKYGAQINLNADKALLLDAQLPQSLIAKALSLMHRGAYEESIPYFEKALEYNPNYDLVFVYLIDLYVNHIPDTEKYLEYALRGLKIDISAYDSTVASINYLHISNAFIQSGFIEEAEKYIIKSLEYDPGNMYSETLKAYILFARNQDLEQLRDLLIMALEKDTTRLDILQEAGKIYYYLRDYEGAYPYYTKFIEMTEAWKLNIYRSEKAKIAFVLAKMGDTEKSDEYLQGFHTYAVNDPSIYKHMNLAIYYSYLGNTDTALEHLKLFSEQEHYFYWAVLFTRIDPLMDDLKDQPEFIKTMDRIDAQFWRWHQKIRTSLKEKGLM